MSRDTQERERTGTELPGATRENPSDWERDDGKGLIWPLRYPVGGRGNSRTGLFWGHKAELGVLARAVLREVFWLIQESTF